MKFAFFFGTITAGLRSDKGGDGGVEFWELPPDPSDAGESDAKNPSANSRCFDDKNRCFVGKPRLTEDFPHEILTAVNHLPALLHTRSLEDNMPKKRDLEWSWPMALNLTPMATKHVFRASPRNRVDHGCGLPTSQNKCCWASSTLRSLSTISRTSKEGWYPTVEHANERSYLNYLFVGS